MRVRGDAGWCMRGMRVYWFRHLSWRVVARPCCRILAAPGTGPMARSFAVVYLEQAVARAPNAERFSEARHRASCRAVRARRRLVRSSLGRAPLPGSQLALLLAGISTRPQQHQDMLLRMAAQVRAPLAGQTGSGARTAVAPALLDLRLPPSPTAITVLGAHGHGQRQPQPPERARVCGGLSLPPATTRRRSGRGRRCWLRRGHRRRRPPCGAALCAVAHAVPADHHQGPQQPAGGSPRQRRQQRSAGHGRGWRSGSPGWPAAGHEPAGRGGGGGQGAAHWCAAAACLAVPSTQRSTRQCAGSV